MKTSQNPIITSLRKTISANESKIASMQKENDKYKNALGILIKGEPGRPKRTGKQGFASMSPAARKKIASMGGHASRGGGRKSLKKG